MISTCRTWTTGKADSIDCCFCCIIITNKHFDDSRRVHAVSLGYLAKSDIGCQFTTIRVGVGVVAIICTLDKCSVAENPHWSAVELRDVMPRSALNSWISFIYCSNS